MPSHGRSIVKMTSEQRCDYPKISLGNSPAELTSSVPLTALPLGVDLSASVDGIFYGYALSTVLFGITIVQAWIYINTNHDKCPLRVLVATLVLADFTTTCLDTQILHHLFIANFGNLAVLTVLPSTFMIEVLITTIIVFCGICFLFQGFGCVIKQFHWSVSVLMFVTSVGAAGAGTLVTVQDFGNRSLNSSLTLRASRLAVASHIGLALFTNIIATTALCWSLAKSHTGMKRTNTLLQKLFQYTVTRGILVTVTLMLFMILYLAQPETLAWLPFHLSLSKVYVITMVAMLNSRDTLRKDLVRGTAITSSEIPSIASRSYINTGERMNPGVFDSSGRKAKEAEDGRMVEILELENYNDSVINEQPLHQCV
ncbi:hypothetical protein BT96DRAFT_388649 [Gymnopus androsaceus JB14]|uniref:DUF6534 domain-containing protein n=1 Tax=Gymnopus androsaceus JB14 TaxID=1447944 RepID=A0A6A4I030_9AGAR|nr:hypothetical protein BT96DRAFT_388649 [Gymnopus androsaceus JB14]